MEIDDLFHMLVNESQDYAIMTLDPEGRVLTWNIGAERLKGYLSSEIIGQHFSCFYTQEDKQAGVPDRMLKIAATEGRVETEGWRVRKKGSRFWGNVIITALLDEAGQLRGFSKITRDLTQRKQSEQELARLNRALRALSDCNQALIRARQEPELLETICNILINIGGYSLVWIGYAQQDDVKSVRPVAHAGLNGEFLQSIRISWDDDENGQGPTGNAIRTGKISNIYNTRTDPQFSLWRELASNGGYGSAIAFPLTTNDHPFGALTIYASEPDAFSEAEEINLLNELGKDLAFGVNTIRLRAEQERSRAALEESEKRYRFLFNGMQEGFALHEIICDETGKPSDYRFLEVNPAFERLTLLQAKDIVGKTVRQVLPGIEAYWIDTYGEVALSGKPTHFENYSKELNRCYEVTAFSPEKGLFAAIFIDITERKQAEDALLGSREFARNIIDSSMDMIIAVDLNRKITEFNKAAQKTFGYSLEEILGQDVNVLYADPSQGQKVNEKTGKENPTAQEVIDRRKNGEVFPCLLSASILCDARDEPIGFMGISRDITEQKRAEEKIRENAARANALVRTAAHLNAQLDLDAVILAVCEETKRAFCTTSAWINLYNPNHETLDFAGHVGLPEEFVKSYKSPSHKLYDANQAMLPVNIIPDVQALNDPNIPNIRTYKVFNIRTMANASLINDGKLVGVLCIPTFDQIRNYSDDELALLKGIADQAALAIINARQYIKAQQRLNYINSLRDIDLAITGSLDLHITLNIILDQVISQLHIDAADVLTFNPILNVLDYAASSGFKTDVLKFTHLRLEEGYAGRAVLEKRIIQVPNLLNDLNGFIRAPSLVNENFVSYFAVPLLSKGQIKGALELFHRSSLQPDQEWLEFLKALGNQAAIAIDNVQLFDSLQSKNIELSTAYDTTLEGWSRALDLRDKETEGHTRRVADITLRLARMMELSSDQLLHFRRGALLHDIGKMGIPDSILLKDGPLTEEEWKIMRMHPIYAFQLLSPIVYLRPALDIPHYHHEKYDGTGYPDGLKGGQIPLAARLFSVADVWDALTSDRPYRSAWLETKAVDYIRDQSGQHFDPEVVKLFLEAKQWKY